GLLQRPEMQQALAGARDLPPERQIRWFAEAMVAWSGRAWAPLILTEDERACYLAYEICYACYGITNAKRPFCAAGDVLFSRLGRAALGHRIHVVEVECAAMGAPHCKYALYK